MSGHARVRGAQGGLSTRARLAACATLGGAMLVGLAGARSQDVPTRLDLAVDLDDDDENSVADRNDTRPPIADLREVAMPRAPFAIASSGPIRVFIDESELGTPRTIRDPHARIRVQGTDRGEGRITITREGEAPSEIRVVMHTLAFEANGRVLDATRDALETTHAIPNDALFVADSDLSEDSFRLRVQSPDLVSRIALRRFPRGEAAAREHVALDVSVTGERDRTSPTLRLVTSEADAESPLASTRLLRVALRDRVDAEIQTPTGVIAQSMRVGRPPREDGPLAARVVALRVLVLDEPSTSVVHTRRAEVETLLRRQITHANEIFAPCAIAFETRSVELARAPLPSLVTVGGEDGLPASGGAIRLTVDRRTLSPLVTLLGETPVVVAHKLAQHLRDGGFDAVVHVLPRLDRAYASAADVLVRHADGTPASVAQVEDTDVRLDVAVASVMLEDGLREFDNGTATTGTSEERALALGLGDRDPSTIDVFVVERFTVGARVGEAFVARDAGPLAGTVVIDFRALSLTDIAFTLAHEIAHVLLDQSLHPGDFGRSSRTSLLSSSAARGDVRGPRRLRPEECARIRSAPGAFLSQREPF